jgi:hypothetical protein
MRGNSARRFLTAFVTLVILALLVPRSFGQTVRRLTPRQERSLETFLQDYSRDSVLGEGKAANYFSASVDLHGNGGQIIVYLADRYSCGSGGCTTLILTPEGSSYRIVTRITIVQLPIRVLATKSNGWYDISVWVQGGGIQPGYEAKLSFDGKTYHNNPSVSPAERLTQKLAGKTVIPASFLGPTRSEDY